MATGPEYFQSAFSIDNVIFGFDDGKLRILLIKRGEAPYENYWALPGDLVYPTESIDDASKRILTELTGLENVYLEQVRTFGDLGRHPVGRVITIAYYSLVKTDKFSLKASSFAQEAKWHNIRNVGELAFDHNEILEVCFEYFKRKVRNMPVGFELLPAKFTLTELQQLYESILEVSLDKRNFRKKILSMNLLRDLEEFQEGVAHRPAKLYEFDAGKYQELKASGFSYAI
ncbi:MAG: NUDIX domain-containing protein [Bacteroidota bacterium]